MNADLSIYLIGARSERCAAIAEMRERGQIRSAPGKGVALRIRHFGSNSVVMSGEGGHFVAALSRGRRTVPWVAWLGEGESERLRPWLEGARSRVWFRRLMCGADALILPSDAARDAWEKWLPAAKSRMFRVYPYLDRAFDHAESRVEARLPIRIVLDTGRSKSMRLGVLRSVLDVFLRRCPELRTSVELLSSTSFDSRDEMWAHRVGVSLRPNVGPRDGGDLVVVLDDAANPLSLPSNFFAALRRGKPLLSVGRSEEASRLLAETGLGLHVDCREHSWADRAAAIVQRAVFRRALKRGLLAEYAPRPSAMAQFSTQYYCAQIETICREVLGRPKGLASPQMGMQLAVTHALEQRLGK